MTNDDGNGNKPNTPGAKALPDETVERIKRNILFGENNAPPRNAGKFKKGQSGNPKGRPKKPDLGSHSVDATVLKEGDRLVTVREGQNVSEMTAIDAVVRKQIVTALSGNAYAQKHVIQRRDWAELRKRERIAAEVEFWRGYVRDHRQAMAHAKAKGEPIPEPLPHPDDVVIDHETGVRSIGPVDEQGLARMLETLKFRDVLLMQGVLDDRRDSAPIGDPLERTGAFLAAEIMNNGVPQRYRLSDVEILMRISRHSGTPKRILLKQVYRAWRELGRPMRRGARYPSARALKELLEKTIDIYNELETEAA